MASDIPNGPLYAPGDKVFVGGDIPALVCHEGGKAMNDGKKFGAELESEREGASPGRKEGEPLAGVGPVSAAERTPEGGPAASSSPPASSVQIYLWSEGGATRMQGECPECGHPFLQVRDGLVERVGDGGAVERPSDTTPVREPSGPGLVGQPGAVSGAPSLPASPEPDELGVGVLSWPGGERVGDRYGLVGLFPEGMSKPLELSHSAEGHIGVLVAEVVETRESSHIGDLFHGFSPSKSPVGERIVLGHGKVFYEGPYVGLVPLQARERFWLDPKSLYRVHDHVVRLFFEEKQEQTCGHDPERRE